MIEIVSIGDVSGYVPIFEISLAFGLDVSGESFSFLVPFSIAARPSGRSMTLDYSRISLTIASCGESGDDFAVLLEV